MSTSVSAARLGASRTTTATCVRRQSSRSPARKSRASRTDRPFGLIPNSSMSIASTSSRGGRNRGPPTGKCRSLSTTRRFPVLRFFDRGVLSPASVIAASSSGCVPWNWICAQGSLSPRFRTYSYRNSGFRPSGSTKTWTSAFSTARNVLWPSRTHSYRTSSRRSGRSVPSHSTNPAAGSCLTVNALDPATSSATNAGHPSPTNARATRVCCDANRSACSRRSSSTDSSLDQKLKASDVRKQASFIGIQLPSGCPIVEFFSSHLGALDQPVALFAGLSNTEVPEVARRQRRCHVRYLHSACRAPCDQCDMVELARCEIWIHVT